MHKSQHTGALRRVMEEPYLWGDQGRETAGLCEAHFDGCGSISINQILSNGPILLVWRTWAGKTDGEAMGGREELMELLS
jgi:hypothetical protein